MFLLAWPKILFNLKGSMTSEKKCWEFLPDLCQRSLLTPSRPQTVPSFVISHQLILWLLVARLLHSRIGTTKQSTCTYTRTEACYLSTATPISRWAPNSPAGRFYWVMYLQSAFLMREVILNSNWVLLDQYRRPKGSAMKGHPRLQSGVLDAASRNKSESGSGWEIGSSPN